MMTRIAINTKQQQQTNKYKNDNSPMTSNITHTMTNASLLKNVGDIGVVKLTKSGKKVPRRVKITGTSFNIFEDKKYPGMEYTYNSSIISKSTQLIEIPVPFFGIYEEGIFMNYSLQNLQLKKEEVTANKPLDKSTTTFSFVSYVDEQGGLSQLECFKNCVCHAYATTDWLMDGHNVKHATNGMFCAKGDHHEYLKTQHNVAPQWERLPLLAPAATVFTEHGFVLKRQNIYTPKMPSKSSEFAYCDGSYQKMKKRWEGHHTSIHQDDKDGKFYLGIQVGSHICFSEDQSNNKIILCTNKIKGIRMLDFTDCYHMKKKLSERSGKEETNKYHHQGFVDHDADDVGYTMMFYNTNGTEFDNDRRLLLVTLLCGLDKMYEQVLKDHPFINNKSCIAIVHSLRKKIKRSWTKPPPKPLPQPPTPKPPPKPTPKPLSKSPSRLDGKENASHNNKRKAA